METQTQHKPPVFVWNRLIAKLKTDIGQLQMEIEALEPYVDYDEVWEAYIELKGKLDYASSLLRELAKGKLKRKNK